MFLCRELLCKILSSSFFKSLFIVRDSYVSFVRERDLLRAAKSVHCFLAGMKVTACTNLFSPMYCLPVFCTFTIDFDQFELQRRLIRINFLPRSSELQVLGIWRRSSELLVFRVFGTWCSESSSLQKLETFIRTSCLQKTRSSDERLQLL